MNWPPVPSGRLSRENPAASQRLRPIDEPRPDSLGESHSRFLHVSEQGSVIRRRGTRLLVTKVDRVLLEAPALKLRGVLLYGNVQVTTQCMRALLDEGVPVAFFSRNGSYKGRLQPPAERGGRLRRSQWERSQDTEFCLRFGRVLIAAKVTGHRRNAEAFAKNYLSETLGDSHTALRASLARLVSVGDVAELRGIEGSAARAYFDLFRHWNRSAMVYPGREKKGATDPINVLLNFGYSLLTHELEGLIDAAGLDPAIGFYHQPHDDRPSLACDWVEEFRYLIDRLVLNLINRRSIQSRDFDDRAERGGLRLSPEGLHTYLRAYEEAMLGRGGEQADEEATGGLRGILLRQLARLVDSVRSGETYKTHLEETPCFS